ncbi:hypothetical protein GGR53DRAFT_467402 [Hypoxylon sp. FL1150]|nr:hypothetical protein GGR53DRAFT_467402 [Hypoxylon sp. FL1150]
MPQGDDDNLVRCEHASTLDLSQAVAPTRQLAKRERNATTVCLALSAPSLQAGPIPTSQPAIGGGCSSVLSNSLGSTAPTGTTSVGQEEEGAVCKEAVADPQYHRPLRGTEVLGGPSSGRIGQEDEEENRRKRHKMTVRTTATVTMTITSNKADGLGTSAPVFRLRQLRREFDLAPRETDQRIQRREGGRGRLGHQRPQGEEPGRKPFHS